MNYSSLSRYFLRFLVVVAFGVIGAVLAEADAPTQGSGQSAPESCQNCHVDVVAQWQTGSHAQAYSDPVFQDAWQKAGQDVKCLACHTTGYVARTGEYTHEGVTCEACHGATPANHPEEPVKIDPGVETCATCHATTVTEWEQSKHGEQQLACTTCHQPHPQTLRFATAKELCLNCHNEDARDDYVHLVHAERECSDCHWHRGNTEDLIAHGVSGNLFPTGHTTRVETRACVSCHEQVTTQEAVKEGEQAQADLGLTSEHPLLEAQVRIDELETEIKTKEAEGANSSALRLGQGLIIGLAVGGVAVFGATRLRRRNADVIVKPRKEE